MSEEVITKLNDIKSVVEATCIESNFSLRGHKPQFVCYNDVIYYRDLLVSGFFL